MIRGTSRTQTGRLSRRRKALPARGKNGSRSVSQQESKLRTVSPPGVKSGRKVFFQPPSTATGQAGAERATALKNFESALHYFRRKDYEKAAALFEKVATGGVREMADRARVHLRLCERMRRQERPPKTAEDYYARGVAALNSRDLDLAIQYLSKSDKIMPRQEYIHYSLAAAYGLQGNPDNALSHLEIATKLRPQNRVQARLDDDFQVLSSDPRFIRLLGTDGRQARL